VGKVQHHFEWLIPPFSNIGWWSYSWNLGVSNEAGLYKLLIRLIETRPCIYKGARTKFYLLYKIKEKCGLPFGWTYNIRAHSTLKLYSLYHVLLESTHRNLGPQHIELLKRYTSPWCLIVRRISFISSMTWVNSTLPICLQYIDLKFGSDQPVQLETGRVTGSSCLLDQICN